MLVVLTVIVILPTTVHSLSIISLGDQLPDWYVAACYRGHCTGRGDGGGGMATAGRVLLLLRRGLVQRSIEVELWRSPGLLVPRFAWGEHREKRESN